MGEVEKYSQNAINFLLASLPNLALALGTLLVGFWVIKRVTKVISLTLEKSGFSLEIVSFLAALANIGLKVMLAISVAGMVGINTAAFVGVLAATGLAVGLALQGSLGNFAAGIIIVTFKPYKVGDLIEVKDKFGKVSDIQIFNTQVITPGNKTLVIPNGEVISGIITNFSKRGSIRIEMKSRLPYTEDFPRFKALVLGELSKIDKVLKSPIPEIGIDEFGENAIIVAIRPYALPNDYWIVYYEVMSRIKAIYHENNIKVPHSEGVFLGNVGK